MPCAVGMLLAAGTKSGSPSRAQVQPALVPRFSLTKTPSVAERACKRPPTRTRTCLIDVKVQRALTVAPTLPWSLMSPLVLLGVFAVIFTVVPVGLIETLVLDRLTVTPAGATTTRVALTVVLSVLLSATAIENSFPAAGAIRNPSGPGLPLTLRLIAMVSFSF